MNGLRRVAIWDRPPSPSGGPPTRPAHPLRRFISLRTKFLAGTVLIVVLVMGILTAIVEHRQRVAIIREVQRRGTSLARDLAAMTTGPLVLYNFTALEQHVARVDEEDDVTYAIVLDGEGKVAAHSQQANLVGSSAGDTLSRRATAASGPLIQEVVTAAGEPLYDFAVPILVDGRRWGTARVGLSRRGMEAEIATTRRQLVGLAAVTLVLGALGAAVVARRIARPMRQLAQGVAAISRGELDQRLEPSTSDELGHLAVGFNEMAGQLSEQRNTLLTQRAALEVAHTELGQRFAELSDLKSYTDHILRSLTAGIITLDLEGRVVTFNASAESLLGSALATARGRPSSEVLADSPELVDLLMETLRTRRGMTATAISLKWSGAGAFPVEVTTALLKGGEGHDLGVLAVVRDLTVVRQLEEQLRQSQKMEAVGRLAGGVAHDFNNLLTVIKGRAELLRLRLATDDPGRRHVDQIHETAELAATLVRQLLAFSRRQLRQPKVFELNGVVTGMQSMLRPLIGEDITLIVKPDPLAGCVKADPGQLEQVIANLVVNARDAMPHGGQLTISTLRVPGEAGVPASRSGGAGGAHARLVVSDTGVGMDAETRAHLFEPFFTTKGPGKGTGLGLATVYGIVTQSGGGITVESEPGRGSTFTIDLPAVLPEAAAPRPTPAPREPSSGWETVLLVEDEAGVRDLARDVLEMHGYTVLEAADGDAALRIGSQHPGPIHLLVTDVVMPNMGGRELADRLGKSRRDLAVLYMSGYTEDAVIQQSVQNRDTAFLEKPFTADALATKVREVLNAPLRSAS